MIRKTIIFLDIDGVLNNFQHWLETNTPVVWTINEKGWDGSCVNNLKEIVDFLDADIVISSSWRILTPLHELQRMFRDWGIREPIDVTPDFPDKARIRGEEIKAYIEENGPFDYLILDDDSDMLPWQMDHFIKTSMEKGLTRDHVRKVKEKWKGD